MRRWGLAVLMAMGALGWAVPVLAAGDGFLGVPPDVVGGRRLDCESEDTTQGTNLCRQRMRAYIYDVPGTTTILDAANEIASAPTAGLNAVTFEIPAGQTYDGVIKPVICSKPTCSPTDAADYTEDVAVFIDGNGNPSASLTLENPTDPYVLTIASAVNATRVAIKATTVNSGSLTITPIATYSRNWQVALGSVDGTSLAPFPLTLLPDGSVALRIDHPRSIGNVPISRQATGTVDAQDESVPISGSGAGSISFQIPSGATATFAFEARLGTNNWEATPVVFETGAANSFPARGSFTRMGYSEYRVRASALSAGSTTPLLEVSPTPGEVASSTCYITSAASNNATTCKATPGIVTSVMVTNTTGTVYYLRLYNSASGPTCSSATGFVETIPALANSTNGRVLANGGQWYGTGIGFCLTGGGSSTDNTNAATGLYVTVTYR